MALAQPSCQEITARTQSQTRKAPQQALAEDLHFPITDGLHCERVPES